MFLMVIIAAIGVIKGADASMCYTCSNINTKTDCFTFTECPANEVCYTSAIGLPTGDVQYNVGCTHNMEPVITNTSSNCEFCTEYCQGDLCNLEMCKLPDDATPTRCFSCDLVSNPKECKHLVECQDSQVCFIRKVNLFGADWYRLGCMDKMHCRNSTDPASVGLPVVGKRSIRNSPDTNCSMCCTTDHCNHQYCSDIPSNVSVPLQLMTDSTNCTETNPHVCSTIGHLSDGACTKSDISALCPVSCGICGHFGWNDWSSWSSCSGSCGPDIGNRTRTRTCIHQLSVTNETLCAGDSQETLACTHTGCPVDGGWSRWSSWGSCYYHRYHSRTRTCRSPSPQNGGSYCTGDSLMYNNC